MDKNIAKRILWRSIMKDFDKEEEQKREKFKLLYTIAHQTEDKKEKEEKLRFLFDLVKTIDEIEQEEKLEVLWMLAYGINLINE